MVAPIVNPALTQLNNLGGGFPPKDAFELGDYLNQIVAALGGGGGAPDVQVFTTPGAITWTKPVGKTLCDMIAIGGGAGGGSGEVGSAGTVRLGGGGGGGGGYATVKGIPLSALGATETGLVGSGGAGGAAVNLGGGNAGVNGQPTYLGTVNIGTPGVGPWIIAGASTGGNAGGAGGAGGGGGFAMFQGASGASSTIPNGTNVPKATYPAASGGGSGGGISALNVPENGSNGGEQLPDAFGGTGGVVGGASPIAGSGYGAGVGIGGLGGGGGAAGYAFAQAGANGGGYGGGGGGGGAASSGFSSGKGGDGTPGLLIVISY